jgi:uncharacterized protein YgiM (DUF1202 family)
MQLVNISGRVNRFQLGTNVPFDKVNQVQVMKRTIVATFLLLTSCAGMAQGEKTSEATMKELSADLAKLHEEVQAVYGVPMRAAYGKVGFYSLKVSTNKGAIYAGASDKAKVLTKPKFGETYEVLDKTSDWYAVRLEKPIGGLNSGWINASEVTPEYSFNVIGKKIMAVRETDKSLLDKAYERLVKSVTEMRNKYEKNPYVSITGFSIDVGIPPSVAISFEFK